MQINKLELKNIKHFKSMSHETPCYNADIFINGKKAIHVSNHGQGACDDHHPLKPFTYKDVEYLEKYLAKLNDDDFEPIDTWCHNQMFIIEDKKLLTRNMKKNIMFFETKADISKGKYYMIKIQNNIKGLIAYIRDKYPQSIILNELSFDKAIKVYRNEEM